VFRGNTGSTKPPAMPWRWAPESVPEMSENLHILKQLSAREVLIVLASFVTRDAQHEYLAKSSWTLKGYILFLYVASLLFSKRWRCLKIVFCTTVILLVLVVLVTVVLQLMAPHSCKWKVKISGLHNPLKISKYVHCLYKCFNSCYFYLWVTNWLRKLNVCVCPGK